MPLLPVTMPRSSSSSSRISYDAAVEQVRAQRPCRPHRKLEGITTNPLDRRGTLHDPRQRPRGAWLLGWLQQTRTRTCRHHAGMCDQEIVELFQRELVKAVFATTGCASTCGADRRHREAQEVRRRGHRTDHSGETTLTPTSKVMASMSRAAPIIRIVGRRPAPSLPRLPVALVHCLRPSVPTSGSRHEPRPAVEQPARANPRHRRTVPGRPHASTCASDWPTSRRSLVGYEQAMTCHLSNFRVLGVAAWARSLARRPRRGSRPGSTKVAGTSRAWRTVLPTCATHEAAPVTPAPNASYRARSAEHRSRLDAAVSSAPVAAPALAQVFDGVSRRDPEARYIHRHSRAGDGGLEGHGPGRV